MDDGEREGVVAGEQVDAIPNFHVAETFAAHDGENVIPESAHGAVHFAGDGGLVDSEQVGDFSKAKILVVPQKQDQALIFVELFVCGILQRCEENLFVAAGIDICFNLQVGFAVDHFVNRAEAHIGVAFAKLLIERAIADDDAQPRRHGASAVIGSDAALAGGVREVKIGEDIFGKFVAAGGAVDPEAKFVQVFAEVRAEDLPG